MIRKSFQDQENRPSVHCTEWIMMVPHGFLFGSYLVISMIMLSVSAPESATFVQVGMMCPDPEAAGPDPMLEWAWEQGMGVRILRDTQGLDCPPPERRRISSGEVQGSVTEELIPPNLPAAALLQLALSSPDLDGLGLAATAQENCAMLDQMSQHPAEDLPTSLLYWHTGVEQQHAHRTLALLGGLEYSCELLDGGAITWCQHEPGRARLVTNTELQASVTTKGGTQLEMETELPKELAAWCDLMRIPKLDCSNIHPTLLTLGSKLWESELELTVPFHQEIPLSFPLLSDPAGPVVREQPIAWVVRVYDDLSVTIPVQHHGVEDSIDCQIQAGDCPEEVALSYCQNLALDSRTCSMLVKEFNSQVWGLGRCFACRDCDCGDAPMQGIQRPLRKLGEKESSF